MTLCFMKHFFLLLKTKLKEILLIQSVKLITVFRARDSYMYVYRMFVKLMMAVKLCNPARFTTGLGATFLLWPTISEQHLLSHNVHNDLDTTCPTAKTGVLGGGAFASLDAALFWMVALMLAINGREDILEDIGQESLKDDHGDVVTNYI
jgi:hypothetical protein